MAIDLNNWDPLQTKLELEEEVVSAAQKREIKNILNSYTGWYDPFSELIQNALDAVDQRSQSIDCPKDYVPTIWVTINLKENSLSVCDNGIGLNSEAFKIFLRPNFTYKKAGTTRGNKGVGATYLGYGFNYLQVSSRVSGWEGHFLLENGRNWVEDSEGIVPRPKFREVKSDDLNFARIDRGVSVTLKFLGDNVRPKNLAYYNALSTNQWEYILRIKTPLGGIYFGREHPPKTICNLKIINDAGEEEKQLTNLTYILPHTLFDRCISINEINAERDRLHKENKDTSRLPPRYSMLNGIYVVYNPGEIASFKNLSEEDKELIKNYQLWAYGFFGYSTKLWDHFNDNIAKLRKKTRILSGGIQMAANFMPQGELITIPLTKNIGYQNITHCVIHYSNANPDLGRKGFQPELEELGERLAGILVKIFQTYREKHLRSDTGQPILTKQYARHEWITKQEEHAKKYPISIKGASLFAPTEELPIKSTPLVEQDVVALFNQLLAAGVIRGIEILSSSEHKTYDGIYIVKMEKPYEKFVYDKIKNPLGVDTMVFDHDDVLSPPSILEYKYSVDGLIEDFDNEDKLPQDINLIIAWEMGEEWKKRYSITSLLDVDNLQHRHFHGVTHVIKDTSGLHVMYAIILSELIDYLVGDFDSIQKQQKKLYGDY